MTSMVGSCLVGAALIVSVAQDKPNCPSAAHTIRNGIGKSESLVCSSPDAQYTDKAAKAKARGSLADLFGASAFVSSQIHCGYQIEILPTANSRRVTKHCRLDYLCIELHRLRALRPTVDVASRQIGIGIGSPDHIHE